MAVYDLNVAIEKDPKNSKAYGLRGLAYKFQGKYDEAISDFSKAIEINPESSGTDGIYFARGSSYALSGQYGKAISDLNIAIEKNPQDSEAYFTRGTVYQDQGRYDKAISDFNHTIEIDPDNADAYNVMAWILATSPDAAHRNGARAVKLTQKAITLDRNAQILDTLAAAYAEAGQFDMAVSTQHKAIAMMKKEGEEKKIIAQSIKRLAAYESNQPWREK